MLTAHNSIILKENSTTMTAHNSIILKENSTTITAHNSIILKENSTVRIINATNGRQLDTFSVNI